MKSIFTGVEKRQKNIEFSQRRWYKTSDVLIWLDVKILFNRR